MEITKTQRELMEHTISGSNRNWFGTGFDTEDSKEFEKLVKAGYATKHKAPAWSGDGVMYCLTRAGKEALEEKGKEAHRDC